MVDDAGRLRDHTIRISTSDSATKGWFKVIVVCVVVSLTVQLLLPYMQLYLSSLINKSSTKYTIKPMLRIEGDQSRVRASYLEEPFPIEQWKGVTSKDIIRIIESEIVDSPTSIARHSEALAALSAAKQARTNGNTKKCKLIMDHALALSPNHPDVLTEYGLYVETLVEDIVLADGYYTKALAYNPHHTNALIGRERTRSIVAEIDSNELKELRRKRDQFSNLPHSTTIRRAMRESYFSHIYHTVSIEGNTLSLGETRSILETGMPIPGKSLLEHNEILGMDSALRFLNRSLIDHHEITIEDILEIHRHVLGYVSPSDAGRLRSTQVYVGRFTPVAPTEVLSEMEELVEWLNDERSQQMDPVERAAIAHYKLVLIHPFVDGNGRTGRLLMNVVLMRNGFPPVILPVEDKAMYYATLHTANLGDLRPFVRFVAKHTKNTLNKYLQLASTCTSFECSAKEDLAPPRIPNN